MNHRRRPRILMLTSTLPRWDGDSEPRFVLDLARHLQSDFDVEIIAPHAPGAARSEVLEGVPITRFRYWLPRWQSVAYEGGISWRLRENPLRLFQVPFFVSSLAWHVIRRLRRRPYINLVHAHWIFPQGFVAVVARRLAGKHVPLVCTSHGGDLFGLRGRMWTALKGWVLQKSDAVTVVSSVMAERVCDQFRGVKAHVIPMGTDLRTVFTPPSEARLPPLERLIFVGRLVEVKGISFLLDAVSILASRRPGLSLEIVGHGPLRSSLESQAQGLGLGEIVYFAGPVPHTQLPAHYRAADIAVFPFIETAAGIQEGFGLVMIEAMGCGCIVIAGDTPAVRDAIRAGETGVLVPSASAADLASAIEAVLDHPEASLAMAIRGRAHVLKRFDWPGVSEKFSAIYGPLVNVAESGTQ